MKAAEFYRKLKANDECWKIILYQFKDKEIEMLKRFKRVDLVYN